MTITDPSRFDDPWRVIRDLRQDAVAYVKAAAENTSVPTLFDLTEEAS
jgi:hypothetical protein